MWENSPQKVKADLTAEFRWNRKRGHHWDITLNSQGITLDGRSRHAALLCHHCEFIKQLHSPNNYQTKHRPVNKLIIH
jgi:hypothetical protein